VRPCPDRLGEISRILYTTVRNKGYTGFGRYFAAIHDRGQLGDANTRYNPGRANRTGADSDLDTIHAGIDKRLCAFSRTDISSYQVNIGKTRL
jgi:hypothetical protein